MEAKARQLQKNDCGSLLIARSRCPYVIGRLRWSCMRIGKKKQVLCIISHLC